MKTSTKRISIAGLSAVCALSVAAGVGILAKNNVRTALAADAGAPSSVYYYDNLTDAEGKEYTLAKKFYNALDSLNKSGDFKDGVVEYALDSIVTSAEIAAWVEDGDLTIPKAFSAARDSYYYDHPELFYVDLYKLTISAGRTKGVYSAFIDCGREADCYIDGGFASVNEVNTAIGQFNDKVRVIADYAKAEAAKDTYDTAQDVLLATYVNTYIAENVVYDYAAYGEYLEDSSAVNAASYAYSAYGSLILGTSVCSGYARGYKAVLDELGVPCVIVSGTSLKKSGDGKSMETGEAHSWNYVWYETPADEDDASAASYAARENVEGAWYAFDVTWNSTGSSVNGYVNMNATSTSRNHVTDPVVSSSGYVMPYPSLSLNNYGNTTIINEFMHSYVYTPEQNGGKDDFGNPKMTYVEYVSYQGKGAVELLDENLHILQRAYAQNTKTGEMYWTAWFDIGVCIRDVMFMDDYNNQSFVPAFYNTMYTQYAVVDEFAAPDLNYNPDMGTGESITQVKYYYSHDYLASDGKDLGEHTIFISEIYTNKTFGTYTPAPYIKSTSPKHTEKLVISDSMAVSEDDTTMADKYAFTLNVTYDEKLHVIDSSKPIGVNFVSEFGNIYEHAFLVPFSGNEYVKLSADGYTLSFRFKPSLMYEHNSVIYSFYFENVGSTKMIGDRMSNKAPNPVSYHFARNYMACNLILGGGRLWIDCVAQPTLVSNSDLAAMDFLDEEGNSTFTENARSQMMLVVESVDTKTESTMLDGIEENFGVSSEDIKSSETYDINLQICGKVSKISDGSYVKIALGFPAGYGPDDEGVTFKIYHRKHVKGDEYIIEEVPCVVTRLGIVATVTSFSPYMVAAVDADKASSDKNIYATVEGKGGTLSKEDGQIKTVKTGETVTFAITPDAGYKIYSVTLNEKDVTGKIVNGILTLSYDEIDANSEIEIKYIANAAAERYEAKDLEIVEPVVVVVPAEKKDDTVIPSEPENPDDGNTGDVSGDNNNTDTPTKPEETKKSGCFGSVGVAGGAFAFAVVVLAGIVLVRKLRYNSDDRQ